VRGAARLALTVPRCTPEVCSIRDSIAAFERLGVGVDVVYPIFPPDGAAAAALARLESWQD
jgi:hypothetical protein